MLNNGNVTNQKRSIYTNNCSYVTLCYFTVFICGSFLNGICLELNIIRKPNLIFVEIINLWSQ